MPNSNPRGMEGRNEARDLAHRLLNTTLDLQAAREAEESDRRISRYDYDTTIHDYWLEYYDWSHYG